MREAIKRQRQQRIARFVRTGVIVGVGATLVWFLFLRTGIPDAVAGHEVEHFDPFKAESLQGTLHTSDPITYASDPPASGAHRPAPADCGVYAAQIPNENMVHTLEHGAVGIFYKPDADPDDIKEIEKLVKSYDSHTFSAPYPQLEDPYTVVAWAHLMRLDEFDGAAISEFIDVFREGGDAPEAQQTCDLNVDTPFSPAPSAPAASPGAEETPHVDETPHEEGAATPSGSNDKKNKKD